MRQTLERDLRACAQGSAISVRLHRLDELEGRPVAHFRACIDDQDISIDNCQFTTDYHRNMRSAAEASRRNAGQPSVEIQHTITHQPDWGSIQIQYRGRKIDEEKLLRYLVLPSP